MRGAATGPLWLSAGGIAHGGGRWDPRRHYLRHVIELGSVCAVRRQTSWRETEGTVGARPDVQHQDCGDIMFGGKPHA